MGRHNKPRRVAALEALREALVRQQAVFASPLIGILTLNESGSIESINPTAQRMFGWPATAALRRDFGCLVDLGGGKDIGTASRLRKLITRDDESREMAGRRGDGSRFPIDFALAEMAVGKRRMFVVFVRDISKRKRNEAFKGEFVATVSHELRTPLTSIAGSLGLLIGGAAGTLPAAAARLLEIAHSNSQRLIRLINDILDIEKMESGKVTFAFRPVELWPLIEQVIESNRVYADGFGVALRLDRSSTAPAALGDSDRIIQVLTNLLSNAIRHSPAGAEVVVTMRERGPAVRISVRNHGPGIPDEFKSRIFGKFAQAKTAIGQGKGGTGLGLHIVKQIVENHDGTVGFEPAPGGATIFFFELARWPDLGAAKPSTRVMPPRPVGAARPRVLHVDDDCDIRHIVAETLRGDAEVVPARSIKEARRALAAGNIDFAVVDLGLGDGFGTDLLSDLKNADGTAIPAVVFSGQDAEPEIADKVDAVLSKSQASLDRLVAILRRMTAAADAPAASQAMPSLAAAPSKEVA
jgi:PAS domain S-box-containing protein